MPGNVAMKLPRAGDLIAGKYAVVRVLGEGGMGVVYEAHHVRLQQRVAIKMLLPAMLAHAVLVERFAREARAAAQLKSRHVARVTDVDATPEGMPYMVMEFLEGWDLQREMESRGQLPYEEAVDYVLQACAAMAEAHAIGIIHRDLKPSNLFLANDGGARVVKALDFGISKVQGDRDAKLTDADVVMGTALYMSPEQVKASHAVDARTDIWSLGVILYEAVAGRAPFMGSSTQIAAQIVTEDAPDVLAFCKMPLELAAVLQKTLQRDPANRFSDVRQLAVALAPFAPAFSIGRHYADSLGVASASGRFSMQPAPPSSDRALAGAVDSAPTVMNHAPPPYESNRDGGSLAPKANALSESRMRPDGTAPGWSQHGADQKRKSRSLVVGAAIAFFVMLAAIGIVLILMRPTAKRPAPTTAAASSPKSPPVLDDPAPPSLDPPPSRTEPAPPPTTTEAPVASSTSKPVVTKPAASPKTTSGAATAPSPATSGAKDKDGKPLFL